MADYMVITSDLKPSQEINSFSFDHRLLVLGFKIICLHATRIYEICKIGPSGSYL